ncbi:MAG: class I SAM-dependent methyltransferase [Planctomycetes bacterium]|nr:class I SAM-dependent methyltransferase [Planctomycetota bacterium]
MCHFDLFDDSLLDDVYRKLNDEMDNESHVRQTLDDLFAGLRERRLKSRDGEWDGFVYRCLRHPLKDVLHQDRFTYHAFNKPRGYSGDAELLDYIYGREEQWPVPETTPLGQRIFEYTTLAPAAEGVRARRGFVADLVDRLADEIHQPHILSIAAGHLREALLSAAVKRRRIGRYVALDSDSESLAEVNRCYSCYGVEAVAASIRQLLTQKVRLGLFDLVYSTGLFDYLPQRAAQRLTWALFQMLRPGGRLLLANFLPGIRDIGYMESYMAWQLVYRTRQEMLDVASYIDQSEIRDIRLFAEEGQNIIFLMVTKR